MWFSENLEVDAARVAHTQEALCFTSLPPHLSQIILKVPNMHTSFSLQPARTYNNAHRLWTSSNSGYINRCITTCISDRTSQMSLPGIRCTVAMRALVTSQWKIACLYNIWVWTNNSDCYSAFLVLPESHPPAHPRLRRSVLQLHMERRDTQYTVPVWP